MRPWAKSISGDNGKSFSIWSKQAIALRWRKGLLHQFERLQAIHEADVARLTAALARPLK
jgi:hypothetical protein